MTNLAQVKKDIGLEYFREIKTETAASTNQTKQPHSNTIVNINKQPHSNKIVSIK